MYNKEHLIICCFGVFIALFSLFAMRERGWKFAFYNLLGGIVLAVPLYFLSISEAGSFVLFLFGTSLIAGFVIFAICEPRYYFWPFFYDIVILLLLYVFWAAYVLNDGLFIFGLPGFGLLSSLISLPWGFYILWIRCSGRKSKIEDKR
ncbi:hypothetical protein STSP1_01883 [Sedimentisphaera salicampi]|uniref:Uncharacterized protein n=1 Tax=Sedimentisphaera salicampi TaxID=1941349 RepID=A0A1W6LP17_9BACT|nr:hypothetical protein STSP1_01883 [Sedimentisphaera salicampi]